MSLTTDPSGPSIPVRLVKPDELENWRAALAPGASVPKLQVTMPVLVIAPPCVSVMYSTLASSTSVIVVRLAEPPAPVALLTVITYWI